MAFRAIASIPYLNFKIVAQSSQTEKNALPNKGILTLMTSKLGDIKLFSDESFN